MPADARTLAEVHLSTVLVSYAGIFPPHAPVPQIDDLAGQRQSDLSDPAFRAFIAEDSAGPIGTVGIRPAPELPGCGELCILHVLPSRQGNGLGSALYNTALQEMSRVGYRQARLWVLAKNFRARSFYERRDWILLPGEISPWPGLDLIDVRYQLALSTRSPGR